MRNAESGLRRPGARAVMARFPRQPGAVREVLRRRLRNVRRHLAFEQSDARLAGGADPAYARLRTVGSTGGREELAQPNRIPQPNSRRPAPEPALVLLPASNRDSASR